MIGEWIIFGITAVLLIIALICYARTGSDMY